LWFELVAAGVGGRTVAEAKERLTYTEALQWGQYIAQRGTLNLGMRMEAHTAQLMALVATAAGMKDASGKQYTPADFMLHKDEQESDTVNFDDALAAFQRIGHGN